MGQGQGSGGSDRAGFCLSSEQIPPNLPCSVTLQPGPEDTGKASCSKEGPVWLQGSYIPRFLDFSLGSAGHTRPPTPTVKLPWV